MHSLTAFNGCGMYTLHDFHYLSFSGPKLLISCIWPPTRLCSLRPRLRVNSVSGPALTPDSSTSPGVNPVQACIVACSCNIYINTDKLWHLTPDGGSALAAEANSGQ